MGLPKPSARTHKPVAHPRKKTGNEGHGGKKQAVEGVNAVHESHSALGQPFVGRPRLPAEGVAERVVIEKLLGGKNALADDGVPECPGVAEQPAPATDEENEPDGEKDTCLRTPELVEGACERVTRA